MQRTAKSAANKSAQKKTGRAGVPRSWYLFWAVAGLSALVAAAYGNSLGNGFVWDDLWQIVTNPAVQAGAPLAPLIDSDARFPQFDPASQTKVYRPLQMLTYRGVVAVFRSGPTAFHVCSVAFAIAGALAAFWLFWLLTRSLPLAFAAAALFAVYPVHTEAVDWIAALPDLGCGLFFLLAFSLFLVNRKALSLAAFAVALLWKETALVFPALLAVYVLVQPAQPPVGRLRNSLKASWPWWVVAAVYLGIRDLILGAILHSPRTWSLNPLQFLLSAAHLLLAYWMKLVLPIRLNAYYVFHPVRSLADPRAALAIVFLVCMGAAVYLLRRTALAVIAIAWVTLTLLPVLDLDALGRNVFTERYLYLPSAGFCLLVVLTVQWLLERLPGKLGKSAGVVALVTVLAAFTAETIARNPDWKDDRTLFAATLLAAPDSPFVHVIVASTHVTDPSEAAFAEENYLEAIDLAGKETPPDRLDAVAGYRGLASLYSGRGEFDQALAELAKLRALVPNDPDTDGAEGIVLVQAGRGKQAEPFLERALERQPRNENILLALGKVARDDLHDLPRAASLFSELLAVHAASDDFSASVHNNLGVVYGDEGNYPAAIAQLRQAIAIDRENAGFHMNLASSLASAGRFAEARAEAQTAVQLAPDDPAAQELLSRMQPANP